MAFNLTREASTVKLDPPLNFPAYVLSGVSATIVIKSLIWHQARPLLYTERLSFAAYVLHLVVDQW